MSCRLQLVMLWFLESHWLVFGIINADGCIHCHLPLGGYESSWITNWCSNWAYVTSLVRNIGWMCFAHICSISVLYTPDSVDVLSSDVLKCIVWYCWLLSASFAVDCTHTKRNGDWSGRWMVHLVTSYDKSSYETKSSTAGGPLAENASISPLVSDSIYPATPCWMTKHLCPNSQCSGALIQRLCKSFLLIV